MKTCPECRAEFQDTISECPEHNIALESVGDNPLIGSCLADRYQIISKIGSGGSGVVYKAQHLKMDKPVAVKMMHSHMVARPESLRSFYDEAKTVAQLQHHNIVTLYDFGISPSNQPFLVMDYIDGPNLKKLTDKSGPLSCDQMRPLLAQIIDGLSFAHSQGIVHQDLKPENIMLTNLELATEKVTLVDFGLATLYTPDKDMAMSGNRKKKFIGSPYYMSPEQCLSTVVVDARSDIYSLAIVLYEALSGQLPFEMKSAMSMLDSHVREAPKPFKERNADLLGLEVCTELTRVFNKAMAKEPENRYETMAEFGSELDDALARDSLKWKAVKHRSVAAEQVLVQARQTLNSQKAIEINQLTNLEEDSAKLRINQGSGFLSQQAAFEEAYFNSDLAKHSSTATKSSNDKCAGKDNIIIGFLKKLTGACDKPEKRNIANGTITPAIECPNCKAPLKQGIAFCLNCQRKVIAIGHPNKLSQTRNSSSFTYHKINELDAAVQQEARDKLQNLRQRKVMVLVKTQTILNHSLLIAFTLWIIFLTYDYLTLAQPWKQLTPIMSKLIGGSNLLKR